MKWVEKSSIENICRLLEISERECHYQVLLTRENIAAVRRNPDPYTLPVIPRPLPSNVVEGEHFMLADVRRFVSGNASSSRDPVVEASSSVQGARSASSLSASLSRGSGSSSAPGRRARGDCPERFLPLAQVAGAAPRVVKVKRKRALKHRNAPGFGCENFIPWVPDDMNGPQDLEEEERMERMAGLLDRYTARKRKRQVSSSGESDAIPVQFAEPSQPAADGEPAADGSSGDQAITIPGSLELRPIVGPEPDGAGRSESNEGHQAPRALQVIPSSDRGEEPPSRSEYMRSGMPRPKRPDQVITNNYLPPRGPELPRVEISALGEEEVKNILRRLDPFHRGASAADRLNSLYPPMYRVPVAARGMGLHVDYTVPLPASTPKEDFLQIIDDGIQFRNRNFVQSTKLVR